LSDLVLHRGCRKNALARRTSPGTITEAKGRWKDRCRLCMRHRAAECTLTVNGPGASPRVAGHRLERRIDPTTIDPTIRPELCCQHIAKKTLPHRVVAWSEGSIRPRPKDHSAGPSPPSVRPCRGPRVIGILAQHRSDHARKIALRAILSRRPTSDRAWQPGTVSSKTDGSCAFSLGPLSPNIRPVRIKLTTRRHPLRLALSPTPLCGVAASGRSASLRAHADRRAPAARSRAAHRADGRGVRSPGGPRRDSARTALRNAHGTKAVAARRATLGVFRAPGRDPPGSLGCALCVRPAPTWPFLASHSKKADHPGAWAPGSWKRPTHRDPTPLGRETYVGPEPGLQATRSLRGRRGFARSPSAVEPERGPRRMERGPP
jgi:hypothetical protein